MLASACLLAACNDLRRNRTHPDTSMESIRRGKELASVYCGSCHQLPDPALLDARSWEYGVLPHMGPRLGIYEYRYQKYPSNIGDPNLPAGYYPAHPAVTPDEWQHILDYYTATAPDTLLPRSVVESPLHNLSLFAPETPALEGAAPATSMIRIDTGTHQLIAADLVKQNLVWYDANLHLRDSLPLFGRTVDLLKLPEGMIACNIGVFNPTNDRFGKAERISSTRGAQGQPDTLTLLRQLQRPVHLDHADFDRDGQDDLVVCEFGYLAGSLSWYRNLGGNHWQKKLLRAQPGALQTYINDYNKDGLPDIWALFAQGEEGVFLFTNQGGHFTEEEVLRFPPSYGSSSFELQDFNGDGRPDILYTCGDNADYSTILKPYHGVYIFLNDGSNHFTQQVFYPVNGCYKALARDFDGDGDLDVACIAYFADWAHEAEKGFVYLENKGGLRFTPHTLPGTAKGRWMTMDAGDLDGDGRQDLVLGNFSIGPTMIQSRVDWEKGPPFMLLRNRSAAHRK